MPQSSLGIYLNFLRFLGVSLGFFCRISQEFDLNFHTVRAEIITELILKRAGPIIFKTFLLELIAFRLIPVICHARGVKPENYWKR